jgi:hypothetical protein
MNGPSLICYYKEEASQLALNKDNEWAKLDLLVLAIESPAID